MNLTLILASASLTRAAMLREAGVLFETSPSRIDEAALTAAMLQTGAPARDIADALADTKARRVSLRCPSALVLGADQVLVCDGKLVGKASNLAAARDVLLLLRGKTHQLISAAVIYENGGPVWRSLGTASMTVRQFSGNWLDGYIARAGDAILGSVGCYHVEGEGAQLFDHIQGDHFTILGMPLIDVLGYLRMREVLPK